MTPNGCRPSAARRADGNGNAGGDTSLGSIIKARGGRGGIGVSGSVVAGWHFGGYIGAGTGLPAGLTNIENAVSTFGVVTKNAIDYTGVVADGPTHGGFTSGGTVYPP